MLVAVPGGVTEREAEVLDYLVAGLTDKEIAERLEIAFSTVRTHLTRLGEKRRLRGRAALAAWWYAHSLPRGGGGSASADGLVRASIEQPDNDHIRGEVVVEPGRGGRLRAGIVDLTTGEVPVELAINGAPGTARALSTLLSPRHRYVAVADLEWSGGRSHAVSPELVAGVSSPCGSTGPASRSRPAPPDRPGSPRRTPPPGSPSSPSRA